MEAQTDYDYTAFIGDIHGTILEFREIIDQINTKYPRTRIILLGDLNDRGPASIACIQLAMDLKLECIRGNHEQRLLKWTDTRDVKSRHYQPYYDQITDEHIQYLCSMPLYIELEDVIAVHAGIKPNVPMSFQSSQDLMYLRYTDKYRQTISLKKINKFGKETLGALFWTSFGPFLSKNIVYGHHVHSQTEIKIDRFADGTACFGIDTGCCFGGCVSALCLPRTATGHDWGKMEIVQVQAKEVYYKSDFAVR